MRFHWIHTEHKIEIKSKLNTYAFLKGEKIEKVVICMHGYGDNAENASHLSQMLNIENILFLFIEGPQSVPMTFFGFQWFDLFHDPHKHIDASAAQILELFKHLTDDHHISSEKIFFLGFSQGAAMALYCGIQTKQKIAGIVSLSGFLVHTAQLLNQKDVLNKEFPILLLHGDQDQTIFPILFFEAQAILEYMGYKKIILKLYSVGHTVSVEEIAEIKKFLTNKDSL